MSDDFDAPMMLVDDTDFDKRIAETAEQLVPMANNALAHLDLRRWEVKALKALKDGKPAAVKFVSEHIPATVAADIAESDALTAPPPREAPKAAQTTQRAQR
jgi:hypothetical protein